ncbi:TPA: phenol-soluble modulin PSM-alpha-4, partial [Staphylococcus aureus]|nr:phenol-soluble modulin PSM-alpha-4 [Staphylococcus aureus]HDA1198055.1 phenol-soluble modulin PSM-alpha-4 [Staphylococcus aureus]HDA2966722.1 phenol-soluble modulin PSM-alpha-4 [Staphylococcus aureus]HDA3004867.1 phenol-soluble modulin PSM-alpha-4 [Staphylococcus aureus]HDA3009192.1 phenol-soluble modulin PSM-alpha-4 [Staphylococcus aureus]
GTIIKIIKAIIDIFAK